MKTAYEFIVVGVGGLGSAAAYWLARIAGREVLALEQFRIGHDNGASQDHSRIIRLSYHTPEYTALTPHTYTAWSEVEAEAGLQLVVRTGGLDVAPAGSTELVDGYAGSMRAAGIPFEELSAAEAGARWPQWRLYDGDRVLYQPESGLVDARRAIQTHVALARAHGATVLDERAVRRIRPVGEVVEVVTDAGTFTCAKLLVTADAWTNQVLDGAGVSIPLTVTQEQVTFFATPNLRDFAPDRFPIWIWHGGDGGYFYGFPVYGEIATKAGEDVGGDVVTPETRTYTPNPRPHDRLVRFLEERIPGSLGPELYTKTCLYTMTPDRNFVLDRLPEHPQVSVGLGAAHGFKFSCLLGQILADLAVEGETRYPIAPFTLNRPALTDPTFAPAFRLTAAAD
jgi:sarcosine oxidase